MYIHGNEYLIKSLNNRILFAYESTTDIAFHRKSSDVLKKSRLRFLTADMM